MATTDRPSNRNMTWYQLRSVVLACQRPTGMRRLAEVFDDPPFEVFNQRVDSMLTWVRMVGPRMADTILETCPSVDGAQTIGALDQRQRSIVAARLRGTARQIERDDRLVS